MTSVADVLKFVNSFHEQCRNMVRDAVRLLRDKHDIYLTHNRAWDYVSKPNEHFLEHDYSTVRRTWTTFFPSGDVSCGALFYFEFFHPNRYVEPALMYGALQPGSAGIEIADRWAAYYTTVDVETDQPTVTVTHDGPIAVVVGAMPKRFEEATLVRVPIETITDQTALETIVVRPLTELLRGNRAEAIAALVGQTTEYWPSSKTTLIDEEENDSEQA